jgi:hypothetical protein
MTSVNQTYPKRLAYEIQWGWKIGVFYICADCHRAMTTLSATAQPIALRGPILPPADAACDVCRHVVNEV